MLDQERGGGATLCTFAASFSANFCDRRQSATTKPVLLHGPQGCTRGHSGVEKVQVRPHLKAAGYKKIACSPFLRDYFFNFFSLLVDSVESSHYIFFFKYIPNENLGLMCAL